MGWNLIGWFNMFKASDWSSTSSLHAYHKTFLYDPETWLCQSISRRRFQPTWPPTTTSQHSSLYLFYVSLFSVLSRRCNKSIRTNWYDTNINIYEYQQIDLLCRCQSCLTFGGSQWAIGNSWKGSNVPLKVWQDWRRGWLENIYSYVWIFSHLLR